MKLAIVLVILFVVGGTYLVFVNGEQPIQSVNESERDIKKPYNDEPPVSQIHSSELPINSEASLSRQIQTPVEMNEALLARLGIPLYDRQGLPLSDSKKQELVNSLALQRLVYEVGKDVFSERVDELISSEDVDEEWAQEAKESLGEWYGADERGENVDVFSECYSSVCYMDISAPSSQFIWEHMPNLRRWGTETLPGFLPMAYSAPTGNEFNRVYFFRDSFDPTDIGASPY